MNLAAILHSIPFDQILIQTVNGIVTGMILALVASGLTLIFGIMDVVNFAHGELFMLGAYVGVLVMSATGNYWLALVIATVVIVDVLLVACVYLLLSLTVLRPVRAIERYAVAVSHGGHPDHPVVP